MKCQLCGEHHENMNCAENWTLVRDAVKGPATTECTIERVREAMAAFRAISKPEFDCVVMTKAMYQNLCNHVWSHPAEVWQLDFGGLYIIPCEDAQTAKALAVALMAEGRRPMLVVSEDLPDVGVESSPSG